MENLKIISNSELKYKTSDGIKNIKASEIFNKKFVVMFGVPGAFTPTCSARHLPGFVDLAKEIFDFGVDTIACVSVNDPFVMSAWGNYSNVEDKIKMFSDIDGSFARAINLENDFGPNLLKRMKRFALIARGSQLLFFTIDERGSFGNTSAENIILELKKI